MSKVKKQNKLNKQTPKKCNTTYLECNMCSSHMEHFQKWYNSTCWDDLLMHMKKFLSGLYIETPYHYGPLQEKDPLYKEKLIKLNEMGILTDNGQEYEQVSNMHEIYMQREYLVFGIKLIDEIHLAIMLEKLQKADFYFQAYAFNNKLDNKYFISNGLDPIGFTSKEFWVTRTFIRQTQEYKNHTHLICHEDMPDILREYYDILPSIQENLVVVEIWAKTWEFPSDGKYLLDKLIECFNE